MRWLSIALGLLVALPAAACGSTGGAIPEVLVCGTPAPLPTSRSSPGATSSRAFATRLEEGTALLYQLREDLRARYPEDTFYRREEFRSDFVAYADTTICLARELRALEPPPSRPVEFTANLDTALDDLAAHSEAGREAVRTRNVSAYREWFAGVDARILAVIAAARRQG